MAAADSVRRLETAAFTAYSDACLTAIMLIFPDSSTISLTLQALWQLGHDKIAANFGTTLLSFH